MQTYAFLLCLASISVLSLEIPVPVLNEIEVGQGIQKSVRDTGIGVRSISLVFVGESFGKITVLKATDSTIEKHVDVQYKIILNLHSCSSK